MPQINLSFWYAISFFLIILSIGYITVEIILGKSYRFRDRIDTSKNPLFDRIMHYIIRGFLINGIILSLFPYIPCIEAIISKIVSWGLEIGQKLNPDNYTEISITISSFLYFFIFILLVTIEYVHLQENKGFCLLHSQFLTLLHCLLEEPNHLEICDTHYFLLLVPDWVSL